MAAKRKRITVSRFFLVRDDQVCCRQCRADQWMPATDLGQSPLIAQEMGFPVTADAAPPDGWVPYVLQRKQALARNVLRLEWSWQFAGKRGTYREDVMVCAACGAEHRPAGNPVERTFTLANEQARDRVQYWSRRVHILGADLAHARDELARAQALLEQEQD